MSRYTNVGKIRELIADLPDSTPVLVPAPDHSFRQCSADVGTVLYDRAANSISEDYGEETTPESEFGKRITVLIVE